MSTESGRAYCLTIISRLALIVISRHIAMPCM